MTELVDRVGPVLAFLVCITVVAEIADHAGVFDVAGHWAARMARGRTVVLWLVVVVLSCAATTVLSLDTTAVLLTPVVITTARQAQLPPLPFAFTTVWLANTASLLLPVSNLSNLLALHQFEQWGGLSAYLRVAWAPALVAMAATVVVIAVLHHRQLGGHYRVPPMPRPHDGVLLRVAAAVCLLLGPLFVTGVTPAIPAAGGALILLLTLAVRERDALRKIAVPWQMVLGVAALFAVVGFLRAHGLEEWIARVMGSGESTFALLRVSGLGCVGGNLINNLPAYLAAESAADGSAHRLMALLIGVNAGPIVTVWGSLATLLWMARCRRAGLRIPLRRFTIESFAVAVVTVVAATLVLGQV
ncbi:arsenic transporter [Flexivirga endophytica]|uniref:Arsenic transporter n=1 Tax=Flexivirga endophytica TaxID=1849103 RepID=A0A916WZC8_9MICO|nr:SLC13 family permease [Flexivirga endophytica]GGB41793.1 arsenic transporter [Flexivirga endophytica]GHB69495.1 arsenic transporter [Flexivirga endophytica]